jgi:hypothetical protein
MRQPRATVRLARTQASTTNASMTGVVSWLTRLTVIAVMQNQQGMTSQHAPFIHAISGSARSPAAFAASDA